MNYFLVEVNKEKGTLMDESHYVYHAYEVKDRIEEIDFFDDYFTAKEQSDLYGTGEVAYLDISTRYAILSSPNEKKRQDLTEKMNKLNSERKERFEEDS